MAGQVMRSSLKEQAQKAPSTSQREAIDTQVVPKDLGLIPETFIRPRGSNLPQWRGEFRKWLELFVAWHKSKWMNIVSQVHYKFFLHRSMRPRPNLDFLHRSRLLKHAESLHHDMYTALAAGDLATLRDICADSILSSVRARIAARRPNARLTWTLHKPLRKARIVSDRASVLPYAAPDGSRTGMRQVVVRMQTRQSLSKAWASSSGGYKEEVEPKDVVEYMVMQRRLWNSTEEPWIVWGFAEETTYEKYIAEKKHAEQLRNAKPPPSMRGATG